MRFVRFTLLISFVCATTAFADFKSDSLPRKWPAHLLPEDLPALKYPSYFKPLDKARLEAFTGRYKRSLMTLWEIKDADEIEVGLIRAQSLHAIGKSQQAVEILSN